MQVGVAIENTEGASTTIREDATSSSSASFFPSFRESFPLWRQPPDFDDDEPSLDSRVRSVPTLAMNESGGFDLLELMVIR